MPNQRELNDGVDFTILQSLEKNLNKMAISRRGLSSVLQYSVDELQDKVAVADDQALLALFDVLEAADAVLHNMESYYECLKAAQARLLNAFVQNQYLELDESAPNGIAD